MCLLHICCHAPELAQRIEVAHLDHALRENSAQDAAFVGRFCHEHAIPFHLQRAESRPDRGESVEAWGRAERYRFFEQILVRQKLNLVLTAHTASDRAETLLMRLVTNKEPRGIAKRDPRRKLLRPLLAFTRTELRHYAAEYSVPFVEDPTNTDTTFLRNRIRMVFIPLLAREVTPSIERVLAERAEALEADIECLELLLAPVHQRLAGEQWGSRAWLARVREELRVLSPPLGWRLAEELVFSKLGFRIGRVAGARLAEFFLGTAEGLQLPGGLNLRRRAGGIAILDSHSDEGSSAG